MPYTKGTMQRSAAYPGLSLRLLAASVLVLAIFTLSGCGGMQTAALQPATMASPATVQSVQLGAGTADVQVFVEPDDGKRVLTKPIRAAARSIDLTEYLLTDKTLIHDLEYANAKGVRVRVLLEPQPFGEGSTSKSANESAYNQLYAAGIAVRWSPPYFRLTYEKAMIIDGNTAYILTTNYTYSAFTANREFGVIDSSRQDVQAAEAIFTADWNATTYVPRDPNLLVSPVNSRAGLLALLRRASRSVLVYAEEVQDAQIENALIAAHARGAQVRLISNAGDTSNSAGEARLQSGGVEVHLVHSPYIHAKMIVVDNRWAFVGSENISPTSLDQNRELGVVITDPDALARLTTVFEGDWHS